eukprot:12311-Eustigmatos_ZCMA.PRE.1
MPARRMHARDSSTGCMCAPCAHTQARQSGYMCVCWSSPELIQVGDILSLTWHATKQCRGKRRCDAA